MPRTATPTVTDFSVETMRKYALSNKTFVAAINKRRKELAAQIEEIDGILNGEVEIPAVKKGKSKGKGKRIVSATKTKKKAAAPKKVKGASRRGRKPKGKMSLKSAILEIIRNNSGSVEVSEIVNHLKKAGFDTSAKSMGVMIQHALRALAEEGMIDRSERGVVKLTAAGSAAAVLTEAADQTTEEGADGSTDEAEESAPF